MYVEKKWNMSVATTFYSQEKQEELNDGKPQHITEDDVLLSSTFLVGEEMRVKIVILKDDALICSDRVLIVISQGANEISGNAMLFLRKGIAYINEGMGFACDQEESTEKFICKGMMYVELYRDTLTTWVVMRNYCKGYVSERIHMSAPTWVEFKGLFPLLTQCTDHYINLVLQGRLPKPENDSPTESLSPMALFT